MSIESKIGLEHHVVANQPLWASAPTNRETLAVVTVGGPVDWFSVHWPLSMAYKYDFAIVHLGEIPASPESEGFVLEVERWTRDRYGSIEVALVGFRRGGEFAFRMASRHPRSFEYFASHSGIPPLSDLDGGCPGQQMFLIFGGRDPNIDPLVVERIRSHFESNGRNFLPFQVGGGRDGWLPGSTSRFLSYFKSYFRR